MSTYTCPVCFFDQLPHPAHHYMICPCCGTEFGYTDFNTPHYELRARWIARGMRWHSRAFVPPPDWNPIEQLKRAGHDADLAELYDIAPQDTEDYKEEVPLVEFVAFAESELKKYSATASV